MNKYLKFFAINLVLIALAAILLELIFGNWVPYFVSTLSNSKSRFTERYYETVFVQCPDKYLHHTHCPEISFRKQLKAIDGGETITSYINRSSIRVSGPEDMTSETNTKDFEIINIGDSLLQAKEVFYEETMSSILEASIGKKVLQVGMGGWAPVNYYSWLKHNSLRQGVEVNIFVPPNDVLPNFGLSNLDYYRIGELDRNNDLVFSDFSLAWSIFDNINFISHLKHKLQMNSVLYRLFVRTREWWRKESSGENTSSPQIFSDALTKTVKDCARINNYDDIKIITRDYVQISFDSSCWNDELRNNVDSGIEDLRKIVQLLKKIKGVVRIFIVPPVLAFEDEGALIKGRLSMSQNAAVTTEPLAQYIADAMSGFQVEVISLEKVIRKHKLTENENLFFANDSHWNREMNRYLGNYIAETIYK